MSQSDCSMEHTMLLHPYPVLGESYLTQDYAPIDLSRHNPELQDRDILSYDGMQAYLDEVLARHGAKIAYGGYAERRTFYQQSPHFGERSVHLGIDLWAPAGTAVYAPFEATVHSFAYNDNYLDYGATIILAHTDPITEAAFYTLYGHLGRSSLTMVSLGQSLEAGETFAAVGAREDNGGWVPHLHYQVILDIQGYRGDYPGVATEANAPRYLKNCPDPKGYLAF